MAPLDYLVFGLVGAVLGGTLAAVGVSVESTPIAVIGFVFAGAGSLLMQIGIVAQGVRVGLRGSDRPS